MRRKRPLWIYMLASAGGSAALILPAKLLLRQNPGTPASGGHLMILTTLTALAVAWALGLGIVAFRGLDEFQQEAGKFSWYWGASAGLGLSAVIYAFVMFGGLRWLDPAGFMPGKELLDPFTLGYFAAVLPVLAGFLAVRVWWRLLKQ